MYNRVGRLSGECIRADPHFMRPVIVTGPVIITVINSIPSTSSKTIFIEQLIIVSQRFCDCQQVELALLAQYFKNRQTQRWNFQSKQSGYRKDGGPKNRIGAWPASKTKMRNKMAYNLPNMESIKLTIRGGGCRLPRLKSRCLIHAAAAIESLVHYPMTPSYNNVRPTQEGCQKRS